MFNVFIRSHRKSLGNRFKKTKDLVGKPVEVRVLFRAPSGKDEQIREPEKAPFFV